MRERITKIRIDVKKIAEMLFYVRLMRLKAEEERLKKINRIAKIATITGGLLMAAGVILKIIQAVI